MLYVQFKQENDTRAIVEYTHYMPFDEVYGLGKSKDELETTGRLVNELPTKKDVAGKQATLYINPQNNDLWYEYTNKPISEENDLSIIKNHVLKQTDALTEAYDAIANLSEEIAILKGGNS